MAQKEPQSPLEGGPSFSKKNRLIRLTWGITWFLFASWTPPSFHPWRRFLLRLFGAKMGNYADVRGSSNVWLPSNLIMADNALIGPNAHCYNQGLIILGKQALVSQGSHLCAGTHDIDDMDFKLITKPIKICDYAWVAADSFVGPGTTIEEGAVLGARGVAFGKLDAWTVYIGNPAKAIRKRTPIKPNQDN